MSYQLFLNDNSCDLCNFIMLYFQGPRLFPLMSSITTYDKSKSYRTTRSKSLSVSCRIGMQPAGSKTTGDVTSNESSSPQNKADHFVLLSYSSKHTNMTISVHHVFTSQERGQDCLAVDLGSNCQSSKGTLELIVPLMQSQLTICPALIRLSCFRECQARSDAVSPNK